MCFITEDSFVKCGTFSGAFVFFFCLFVFSNMNGLFLRLLMFVSLGRSEGLRYYICLFCLFVCFPFSAKET